jgi:aspartate/methionine/tyrosine aminotransferase
MAQTKNELKINQNILDMEYAVRGPIAKRAAELQNSGREIIPCHIGNPQALGQRPITYFRQVLSLVENPTMIERERQLKDLFEETPGNPLREQDFFADEILALSEKIISQSKTGTGAYTESKGFQFVREAIADFINKRDGFQTDDLCAADPDSIFLTNGASQGVKFVIDILVSDPHDGIMIPIPQYPLYSATIKKAGGVQVDYFPDEESGWVFDEAELERAFGEAVQSGVTPKALVVINPGNPTGAILTEACMRDIVSFAKRHNLIIIADEVYQENIYQGSFTSFAKILGAEQVSLISLHSISKGFYGECGHRGGYMEVRNPPQIAGTDSNLTDIITKQASVSLCSNTPGQLLTYLMVSPLNDRSCAQTLFLEEKHEIIDGLQAKAEMIRAAFIEMDGVECFGETSALYLFPRLGKLPEGKTDFDYCMALLEETGLCTVNGSGFGQKKGTHHMRIAFLPPKEVLEEVLPKWIDFHNRYVNS